MIVQFSILPINLSVKYNKLNKTSKKLVLYLYKEYFFNINKTINIKKYNLSSYQI